MQDLRLLLFEVTIVRLHPKDSQKLESSNVSARKP
jgi:hypothetical protein